ncbi:hypothetical protein T439DRAFT_359728 [Meredithblackwellia eburnea MCA 4105]
MPDHDTRQPSSGSHRHTSSASSPDPGGGIAGPSGGDRPSTSSSTGNELHLPPILPPLPGRPVYLAPVLQGIPRTSELDLPPPPFIPPADVDPSLRRLLLLQTLAAQQQQILQALSETSAHLGDLPNHAATTVSPPTPGGPSGAPTPPTTPQVTSPANAGSPTYSLPPQSQGISTAPSPHQESIHHWPHVLDGLNAVNTYSPNPTGRVDDSDEGDLRAAQIQLDAWSRIAFNSPSSASSPVPGGLPGAPPLGADSAQFLPPQFDWSGTTFTPSSYSIHSSTGLDHIPPQLSHAPAASTSTSRSSAADTKMTEPPRPSRAARAKSTSRSESITRESEDEDSVDPEEDKRRRNTAASARFRAKKKQRDAELQTSSAQLRERLGDLEKEAASSLGYIRMSSDALQGLPLVHDLEIYLYHGVTLSAYTSHPSDGDIFRPTPWPMSRTPSQALPVTQSASLDKGAKNTTRLCGDSPALVR